MDWTRGRTIGLGSSATVSIAKSHRSGEVFAVKSAELSQSQFLQKEQTILSTLSSPYIGQYKGHNISNENGAVLYNIFLEYVPGGTISDAIRRQGGCLNKAATRCYARQILLGLQHLHSNQIAHCDVKCQNILVAENGAKVKLADLGCARRVKYDHGSPIGGTPLYMAPEVARGEEQGTAAEVWALGCTIIEMATGRAPWPDVCDPVSALYRIGFSGDVPGIPSSLSKQGRDFVAKCLIRDPLERWSAGELLEHGFFLEARNDLLSPTTVLDRGLLEEEFDSGQIWDPTRESGCSDYSAKERIRHLSEGNTSSLEIPNWACDEDNWVTVRSYNIEKQDVAKKPTAFLPSTRQFKLAQLCPRNFYVEPTSTYSNMYPNTNQDTSSDATSFSSKHRKSKAWMASKCNKKNGPITRAQGQLWSTSTWVEARSSLIEDTQKKEQAEVEFRVFGAAVAGQYQQPRCWCWCSPPPSYALFFSDTTPNPTLFIDYSMLPPPPFGSWWWPADTVPPPPYPPNTVLFNTEFGYDRAPNKIKDERLPSVLFFTACGCKKSTALSQCTCWVLSRTLGHM